MSTSAANRKNRRQTRSNDTGVNSTTRTDDVDDEQNVPEEKTSSGDESNVSEEIVNTSIENTSGTKKGNEKRAQVTPEKRPSVFQLRAQAKKGQIKTPPVSRTQLIHNAIHSETAFLDEAIQKLRWEDRKNTVMNVIYPFLTRCGGIALCMVKESNPKIGAFLGSLVKNELVPTPFGQKVMPGREETVATKLELNYCFKLRKENDINDVHSVPAEVNEVARKKAAAENRTLYTGVYTTPVYIYYPRNEKASEFMLTKKNAKKLAETAAGMLERKMERAMAKMTKPIRNLYRVADPMVFRSSNESKDNENDTILLGEILKADDIMVIVQDVFDIYSWSELLENSNVMDAYFGTKELRTEVESIKRNEISGGSGFYPGLNQTGAQKREEFEQKEDEKKKKQMEEEEEFLAYMRGKG